MSFFSWDSFPFGSKEITWQSYLKHCIYRKSSRSGIWPSQDNRIGKRQMRLPMPLLFVSHLISTYTGIDISHEWVLYYGAPFVILSAKKNSYALSFWESGICLGSFCLSHYFFYLRAKEARRPLDPLPCDDLRWLYRGVGGSRTHLFPQSSCCPFITVESPQLTSRIVSMSFNTLPIREPVGERVI